MIERLDAEALAGDAETVEGVAEGSGVESGGAEEVGVHFTF